MQIMSVWNQRTIQSACETEIMHRDFDDDSHHITAGDNFQRLRLHTLCTKINHVFYPVSFLIHHTVCAYVCVWFCARFPLPGISHSRWKHEATKPNETNYIQHYAQSVCACVFVHMCVRVRVQSGYVMLCGGAAVVRICAVTFIFRINVLHAGACSRRNCACPESVPSWESVRMGCCGAPPQRARAHRAQQAAVVLLLLLQTFRRCRRRRRGRGTRGGGGRHSQHSHGKRINYGRFACVHALGFKVYPSRVHQFQRYRTPRHSVNEILPPHTFAPSPCSPIFSRNRFGVFSEIDRFWVVTVFNRPYILWRMDARARWLSHVHGSISCSISFADFTCKFARWLRVWARRSAAQRVLNGQQQIDNITQMLALARMQMRVVFVLATKPSIYIHVYDDACECVFCACDTRRAASIFRRRVNTLFWA